MLGSGGSWVGSSGGGSSTVVITSSDDILAILESPLGTFDLTKGTGFDEFVDDRVAALLVAGAGISLVYSDVGNSLTISSTITQYTDEMAQDTVAALIQNGTGISWSYSDVGNSLTPTVTLSPFSTTDLVEGSNLYYTDERVDDRVAALLVAGTGISLIYSDAGNTLTINTTITQYTDELAQDAVFGAMVDSSSIDFQYNDAGNSWTAVVLPAGVDHNSLANLTAGDPHTQYVLDGGTFTDNRIIRADGTDGRHIQDSGASIDDSGNLTANNISGTTSGTNTGDQLIFQTIACPAGTNPVADTTTDTLTFANGAGISITGTASSDTVTIASTITQYTDELAQDAVGGILTDSASIDFTYNDGANTITAVVLAAGVDHGGLGGLSDDDHTQYMLAAGAVTSTAIAKFSGTGGRNVANSGVLIDASNNVTGALTIVVGASTPLTTISGGTVASDDHLTLTSTTSGKYIYLTTTGATGRISSNQFEATAVMFASTSAGGVYLDQDGSNFAYDKAPTLSLGAEAFTYVLATATITPRYIAFMSNPASSVVGLSLVSASATAAIGPGIDLARALGTSATSYTTISGSGFNLGTIRALGADGTDYGIAATIVAESGGAFTSTSAPGVLKFSTTAVSALTPTLRLTIDQAGLFTFPIGTISAAGVGSAWTQWNVDNLRLDGNTLSSTSGALILDSNATGIQMSDPVEMAANLLKFGASNESSINYSTNLIINPMVSGSGIVFIGDGSNPSNIQAGHYGAGDSGPTTTRMFNCNESNSTVNTGMSLVIEHTGSTTTVRGMSFTATHSGSATSPLVASAFLSKSTVNPTGTVTALGISATAENSATITQGTKVLMAVRGTVADSGTSHSAGTVRAASIHGSAVPAFSGVGTLLSWAGLFEDDVQISSDKKLILEGSATAKGDTYLSYISASTAIDTFVGGAQITRVDAAGLKLPVAGLGLFIKEGTNATMGVATLVAGTVTVNTTKAVTGVRIFLSRFTLGGTVGTALSYTITTGTSFTINSNNILDTSVVNWIIIAQA